MSVFYIFCIESPKIIFYIESIFILNKISPGRQVISFIIHDILQKVKGKQSEKMLGGV